MNHESLLRWGAGANHRPQPTIFGGNRVVLDDLLVAIVTPRGSSDE
jgi:hypothetical protein